MHTHGHREAGSPPAPLQDKQHTARHQGYRPHLALAPWKPFPLLLRPPASGSFDQPPPHFSFCIVSRLPNWQLEGQCLQIPPNTP